MAIKAVVQNRRLVIDGEFDLPDGTELQLVIDEDGVIGVDPETAARVRAAFDRIGNEPAVAARDALTELRGLRDDEVPRSR